MKAWLIATLLGQSAALALAQTAAAPPAAASAAAAPRATAPASGARPAIVGKLTPASFKCGGVGADEQERIKAQAADHDILVTFSTPTGAYVADVEVEIARGGQVVAQGTCRGPLMLVDAVRGRYEIRARSGGKEQRKSVMVGPRVVKVSIVFPG